MKNASPYYESIEFSLSTGESDYDLDSNQSEFLAVFKQDATGNKWPTKIIFRTDQTISFKLNSTSDDSITVTSTDSPFTIDGVEIRNVYITNSSGSTAAIKLFFQFSPNKE